MATKLIDSLEKLCKEVLDSDVAPRINIQLFTDIKETVDDLQKVMLNTSLVDRELIIRSRGLKMKLRSRNSCLAFNWPISSFRSTL
jgi:hypothetical protein